MQGWKDALEERCLWGGIGAWGAHRILEWFELEGWGGFYGRSHDVDPMQGPERRQCPTSALGSCWDPQLFHPNRGAETSPSLWKRKIPREMGGLIPACLSTRLGRCPASPLDLGSPRGLPPWGQEGCGESARKAASPEASRDF